MPVIKHVLRNALGSESEELISSPKDLAFLISFLFHDVLFGLIRSQTENDDLFFKYLEKGIKRRNVGVSRVWADQHQQWKRKKEYD